MDLAAAALRAIQWSSIVHLHLPRALFRRLAQAQELDLVMVSPRAVPPVARITDFSKVRDELSSVQFILSVSLAWVPASRSFFLLQRCGVGGAAQRGLFAPTPRLLFSSQADVS